MSRSSLRTSETSASPTILVFTEGTVLMHSSGAGLRREDVVRQAQLGKDPSLAQFAGYVPIGEAAAKLRGWHRAGAAIVYLTSRRTPDEIRAIRGVLRASRFPRGRLAFRRGEEGYADVAARVLPTVLGEDDCESLGGEPEMTYPNLPEPLKRKVRSVVVMEFAGIDQLPDDPRKLASG